MFPRPMVDSSSERCAAAVEDHCYYPHSAPPPGHRVEGKPGSQYEGQWCCKAPACRKLAGFLRAPNKPKAPASAPPPPPPASTPTPTAGSSRRAAPADAGAAAPAAARAPAAAAPAAAADSPDEQLMHCEELLGFSLMSTVDQIDHELELGEASYVHPARTKVRSPACPRARRPGPAPAGFRWARARRSLRPRAARDTVLTAPACSLGRRARTDRQRPGTHAYIT